MTAHPNDSADPPKPRPADSDAPRTDEGRDEAEKIEEEGEPFDGNFA